MRRRHARRDARCLLVLAVSLGCGSAPPMDRSQNFGPPAEAPPVGEVPVAGYATTFEMKSGCALSGELLAADDQSAWLFVAQPESRALDLRAKATKPEAPGRVFIVSLNEAERVSIELHPSDAAITGGWTALGAASTVSHGGFLVLSLPLWLATGIPVSVGEARSNDAVGKSEYFERLFQFARFPQGIPLEYRRRARPGKC
jgi:hypothetical protein